MEITKKQKEAIEYLEKYTKWETYGERNLEKDIITVLNLVDKLQEENKKYKEFFNSMFLKCDDKETDKLVDEILKLESEE